MSNSKCLPSLLIAIISGLFVQVSAVGGQDKASIQFEPITFTSTAGETVAAESGWISVPERHASPGEKMIQLPVIRFRSTVAKPGPPIIYLAGGPGASGIASAKGAIFPLLQAFRQRADVIVFDQRGTGDAKPSLFVAGKVDLPNVPLSDPASRKQLVEKAKTAAAEIRARGIDLAAYNTDENASDVNDLRLALGADKVTIWGHSYGSHLGLAFIKRYGQFIEKAMLGGVNGLDQRWRYPQDLEDLIDRLDARIKKNPRLQRKMPSLRETIESVLKKLEDKPVTVDMNGRSVIIGRKDLDIVVALQAGDIEFVKNLPQFFATMERGNYSFAAQMVQGGLRSREIGTSMRYAMHIASGASAERRARIDKQRRTALFGDAINFPFDDPEFCDAWRVPDLGDDFRAPITSTVPTLFMSATFDGRTSVADAEEIRKGFSRSQHLIIDGASHDFYGLSPQVLTAMQLFLDGKPIPAKIDVPLEIRAPAERDIVLSLRRLIQNKGIDAAVAKIKELGSPRSDEYVTSYVIGVLAFILQNDDKLPNESFAVLMAGMEIFPHDEFLTERLADAHLAAGRKPEALALYRKCLELNSMNQTAALKAKELGGK